MSTPPRIHVTNWPSKKLHGPGRKWTIMVEPREWECGEGVVSILTPYIDDLHRYRESSIPVSEFRERYLKKVKSDRGDWGESDWLTELSPGRLRAYSPVETLGKLVSDGDTLCCMCARDVAKKSECHRAWAADLLREAGWDVVLDGEAL